MKRKHKILLLSIFSFCMVATLSFLLVKNMNQSNATMAGFKAGNIISDYVMGNYNSMTESQIQSFLKSKNSCDDSDRAKYNDYTSQGYSYNWKNGHFVCMADEDFDGESAAHIIYTVAQEYKINPQVLIVLLQKEQGLITDTWPNSRQYRVAAGYGCPDSGEYAGVCMSQYYGLRKQLSRAAEIYREALDDTLKYDDGWGQTHFAGTTGYVQYNPDEDCGGSYVYFENSATAVLYDYTPYQPNDAALDAGYGAGDYCSSHGNRNFYNYFTDWFGSTQDNGFKELDTPRYFEVIESYPRINPYTLEDSGEPVLSKGQEIKFTTKIYTQYGWCFRTEHNTNNGIFACIPQSKLKEVTLKFEDVPKEEQSKVILPNTHKTYIRKKAASQYFNEIMTRTFVKRVTFQGTTYYITDFDYQNNNSEYGVPEQFLVDGYQAFKEPREMTITKNTERINPLTEKYYDTISKDKVLKFTSKIYWNNQWYYRTEYNTNHNEDYTIPASSVTNLPAQYEYFEYPYNMILTKDTDRINFTSGEKYDTLKAGRVISFSSRAYFNDQWYYRTEYNTNEKTNYVIPSSSLEKY